MYRGRKAKIIATLGPASSDRATIVALVRAGADTFRLNASHGTHADLAARYAAVREAEEELGRPVGILVDLQGPKLRIGAMQPDVVLREGQVYVFDRDPTPGNGERAPLPHPEIFAALKPGGTLLLNDGKLRAEVTAVSAERIETVVKVGGPLSGNKGVNVPDALLPLAALSDKDRSDLDFALQLGVDWVALSFVQRTEDVLEARAIIGDRAGIVAKIEKPQALDCIGDIVRAADAVMVARGDLGVEMPPEQVPSIQKRLIRLGRAYGRPVIVATQMLESMIDNPVPTRAEVSDVAGAVYDGADAVMLSAESAVGKYPLEAVAMMNRVIDATEHTAEYHRAVEAQHCSPEETSADAITAAAATVATTIHAAVIVTFTSSGSTALRAARERPSVPLLALTPRPAVARRLMLVWGLNVAVTRDVANFREMTLEAARVALEAGYAQKGEKVVITAGVPFGVSGSTNVLRIAAAGTDYA